MTNVSVDRRTALTTAAAATVSAIADTSFGQEKPGGRSPRVVTDLQQWCCWRGPRGDNAASDAATGPIRPDASNVRWATPISGRGHSSPIVSSEMVYLTTADKASGVQAAIGIDRETGKTKFQTPIHRGGIPRENHPKNTEASPTPAFDGVNLFVTFYNSDSVRLTSLTADGQQRWQKQVAPYSPDRYKYGYAASPVLYGDLLIVASEMDRGSAIVAFDRENGREVWRRPRPVSITFSSPIVGHVAGRDQLLISGAEMVASYDPATGQELWKVPATTMATCGTMVWNDTHVFASGGYPKAETVCVAGDGSGRIEWSNTQKCYEQSLLLVGEYLYGVTDAGVAHCWRASDGKTMWRQRLGGKWSSSPLLVGNRIHAFNEGGEGWAFDATPEGYVERSNTQVGDEVFATPAVVGDTMYMRIADNVGGRRQESLLAMV